MNFPAFLLVSPPFSLKIPCPLRRDRCLRAPSRLVSNHIGRSSPFLLCATNKLYPDPLPPDDDVTISNDTASSNAASYLEKLNQASANRRIASTGDSFSATSLDPETAATGKVSPNHGSVLSSLQGEQSEQRDNLSAIPKVMGTYASAARALWRIGWATWWVQLILTMISAVILLFSFAYPSVDVSSSASALGLVFVTIGIVIAFVSLVWTYSYTRLSLWLSAIASEEDTKMAAPRITHRLRLGMFVALAGLVVSILGLQAIVGILLGRLLSVGFARTSATIAVSLIQPIDILVVQASANVIMSLLAAVITTTWFRGRLKTWEDKAAI